MVYVLLANGFEEIEALAFTDILRRAEIDVRTVSITSDKQVSGSHGITVLSDITISQVNISDLTAVVLPGGMPGTLNLKGSTQVTELLEYAHSNNKYIGAICAAPMVIGEMGILKHKKATCYPGFEKHLIGADVVNEKVVIDGKVITSKGAGTVADFAHGFITELKDKTMADNIISSMQY